MPRKTPPSPTLNVARRQDDTPAPRPDALETRLAGAREVPIDQVEPDPDQPRRDVGDARLDELAASFQVYGVLQPLLVREDGALPDTRPRYRIIAGGRRYAAALLAGLTRLPVVVSATEGAALRRTQLVENIQRQDLSPLDEARAFQELMDTEKLTAPGLGQMLGISGQHVRDRLLLLSNQTLADAVERGQVAASVARDVLRMADEPQATLLARIDDGEAVDSAAVQEARAQATASGVANPRSSGGGRAKRTRSATEAPPETPPAPRVAPSKQTSFASSPLNAPRVDPVDGLKAAVGPLDVAALARVAQFGAAEGWSCAELLVALEAMRSDATG